MTIYNKLIDSTAKLIIAVDGPAASGKGTIAKLMAEKYNLVHVESGRFYRELAAVIYERNIDISDAISINEIINKKGGFKDSNLNIYSEEVAGISSQIATLEFVRTAATVYLRKLIDENPRVIMEGRDIGTVVVPEAELKIYLSASAEERAKRRLGQNNNAASFEELLQSINERDERDAGRSNSPMMPAIDAFKVDTTSKPVEEVLSIILEYTKNKQ